MAGSARSSVSDDGVLDAVVVGAGLGGVCMLNRLRSKGFSARVFEAGGGIGGTWFWNRYPGARCDAPSMEYSYQFSEELQQDWNWSEKYATQPEILRYINHVADRFDLRPDIQLNTCVISATYDEADGRWSIQTDDGSRVSARFCIMATGVLSSLITPDIKGLDTFAGPIHYTGRWPQVLDGKTVLGRITAQPERAVGGAQVTVSGKTVGLARHADVSRQIVAGTVLVSDHAAQAGVADRRTGTVPRVHLVHARIMVGQDVADGPAQCHPVENRGGAGQQAAELNTRKPGVDDLQPATVFGRRLRLGIEGVLVSHPAGEKDVDDAVGRTGSALEVLLIGPGLPAKEVRKTQAQAAQGPDLQGTAAGDDAR